MPRLVVLLMFLTACASPSLEFRGAVSKSVIVSGDAITVFFKNDKAQAIRTNYRTKKQRDGAVFCLVEAIEVVTDCKVNQRSIKGDVVLITATIKC
jgi:hypothetical protein